MERYCLRDLHYWSCGTSTFDLGIDLAPSTSSFTSVRSGQASTRSQKCLAEYVDATY